MSLHRACCCCVCPAAPAATIKLDGYTDGDLTACGECDASGSAAWSGTMPYVGGPFPCLWQQSGGYSINGKALSAASVSLDEPNNRWILEIGCTSGADDIWEGYKSDCSTPLGTYTRNNGCDTTATLDVVLA